MLHRGNMDTKPVYEQGRILLIFVKPRPVGYLTEEYGGICSGILLDIHRI